MTADALAGGLGAGRIRELLQRHGIDPRQSLGQNFLADPNTARRIAEAAEAGPGAQVLEIGPGLGSLTVALAALGAQVTAGEIDDRILPALAEVIAGLDVEVHAGDALDVDMAALTRDGEWRLAGNLPYNIGTQILLRVLEHAPRVQGGVVLVQREVAERLTSRPGSRAYGIPTVKAAWWADLRLAGRVQPTVFLPRPKVESAFVTFERRDPPGSDDLRRRAFALVEAAFGQRRKMLRRSLEGVAERESFLSAGVDPEARPETLALDDFVRLARLLAAAEPEEPR